MVGMAKIKTFTPPDSPEGCIRDRIFVGKVERRTSRAVHYECGDGEDGWWLTEKMQYKDGDFELTYRTPTGFVQEFYREDGSLRQQIFLDENCKIVHSATEWTDKFWHPGGKLASWDKYVPTGDTFALEKLIAFSGGKLITHQSFNYDGTKCAEGYLTASGGHIFEVMERWNADLGTQSMFSTTLGGATICAPENKPCQYFVDGNELKSAMYTTFVDGKIVYHRTDGPAIIDRYAPKGEQERYFIAGKEYTKREWEKITGKKTSWLGSLRGN